ncbi:hypothetical protein [Hymenobacter sediminicola]|uniref:Uncharacterized protein n=1 Tax=Hymenobacter sediminicola TaxID=2761579 RepID=A0A7G7W320_9BACT|nr:hypothetical protein [Hymenobacter sediminicola]QNH60763.1 hypothetical protein H4317_11230 [Hymenobacter sediminicola]
MLQTLPLWTWYVMGAVLALVALLLLVRASQGKFGELLVRSLTEDNRFSPRLLTTFAIVAVTVYLELRGAHMQPEIVGGVLLTGYPPEYVLLANIGLIAALLGIGTWGKVQLGKTVPDTVVQSDETTIKTDNVQVNKTTPATPATTPPAPEADLPPRPEFNMDLLNQAAHD